MPAPPLHKASTNLYPRKLPAPARAYCLALGCVLNTHVTHSFGMAECRMPHGPSLHPWRRPPRAPDADTDQLLVNFECDNPDVIICLEPSASSRCREHQSPSLPEPQLQLRCAIHYH
jgi:hypothetical protein